MHVYFKMQDAGRRMVDVSEDPAGFIIFLEDGKMRFLSINSTHISHNTASYKLITSLKDTCNKDKDGHNPPTQFGSVLKPPCVHVQNVHFAFNCDPHRMAWGYAGLKRETRYHSMN
jgi:hypothetical protein